ncbi:MAG: hypothetical protein NVSMB21_23150 [Vulcanimicrobiaceae bacterium]
MLRTALWVRATFALTLVIGGTTSCRAAETASANVSEPAYADVIRSINPAVREVQSRQFARALLFNAHRAGLDPNLVMAVVTVESHWNARAVSSSGARGLGQFLPGTARDLGIDPRSPSSNLRGVTNYLHQLLGMFATSRNAMRQAIASYNAGPYAVRRHGIPRYGETPRYVVKVMSTWRSLRERLGPAPRVEAVAAVALTLDPATRTELAQNAYWGAAK